MNTHSTACNLGDVIHIVDKELNIDFEIKRGYDGMFLSNEKKYEELTNQEEMLEKVKQNAEIQIIETTNEMNRIERTTPELLKKKVLTEAERMLDQLKYGESLAFKEFGRITVAVDVSYYYPNVIDFEDIGISYFEGSLHEKESAIEQLKAGLYALEEEVPRNVEKYYDL